MNSMRRLGIVAILTLSSVYLQAGQQPNAQGQNPGQISVITFMGDVNAVSAGMLIQLINGQVRNGVHKITVVISSGGGEPTAAFAAYNYLRNLPVELTTFNIGNVDSAAIMLYCAGRHRYSLPATRFLIHGNSLAFSANTALDVATMQGNLEILKSLNQTLVHVVLSATNKTQNEVEAAVRGQLILTPEEAKNWGLVHMIKNDFMEPGAVLVSVSAPPTGSPAPPMQFTSTSPTP